jgi:hypothetical protein
MAACPLCSIPAHRRPSGAGTVREERPVVDDFGPWDD